MEPGEALEDAAHRELAEEISGSMINVSGVAEA